MLSPRTSRELCRTKSCRRGGSRPVFSRSVFLDRFLQVVAGQAYQHVTSMLVSYVPPSLALDVNL